MSFSRTEISGSLLWCNRSSSASCSKLARLEQLEELDLSGNRLRAVPTTILSCQRMHTLSAHSNCINAFPEVLQLPEIKVSKTREGFSKSLKSVLSHISNSSCLVISRPSFHSEGKKVLLSSLFYLSVYPCTSVFVFIGLCQIRKSFVISS